MSLTKYNQKRDFKKTAEPEGKVKKSGGALKFVVQKHAASHLHYDFRLEIDGVLVSWAVPKGPSANPSDKRLAMHVEDHPMDYLDFEGTIPKGEYGGGTVMVWDIGTYEPEGGLPVGKHNAEMKKQHKSGSIKIVLHGKKLQGSWALVEMHGRGENQWLLIKHKDEFAGPDVEYNPYSILTGRDFDAIASGKEVWVSDRKKDGSKRSASEMKKAKKEAVSANENTDAFTAEDLSGARKIAKFPTDWKPQLATLADAAFDDPGWLFEKKLDGYRAIAEVENGKCRLVSRNGLSFDGKYPEINRALDGLTTDTVLDGEIVMEDAKGHSHFQWLQNRDLKPKRGKLRFYVFDILYFSGFDLRGLDLLQRKKILKAVLPQGDEIAFSEHLAEDGIKAMETAGKEGWEGIIAKKISSAYKTGSRTKDWLKIKIEKQQEMVIGGFTEPSGGRSGIGALLCGYYEKDQLRYSGKVGSGFSDAVLRELRSKLERIERKSPPFADPPRESQVHWVSPSLVAQIKFSEITESGAMRHPVFLGLRTDKKAKDVALELPKVETETDIKPKKVASEKAAKPRSKSKPESKDTLSGNKDSGDKSTSNKKSGKTEKAAGTKPAGDNPLTGLSTKVEFSNPDKIFWPREKITKGDVILYYNAIAEYILPFLRDRPQSMRRTPDGIKSEGFFQKNVAGTAPKWAKTRKIKSDSKSEPVEWLICNDKDTLLYMANIGCIEMNPWSSRVGSLNNPDYIIFDLDPKGAPLEHIVATARELHGILEALKVPSFIKTSGGNGLHVFIPVKPEYSYDQTRDFSHIISQMVHKKLPGITSLERMPDKRKNKVYLDFLQNGRGKTMASIYSLRPREGAGVSTPLEWSEVNDSLVLQDYNLFTIPGRLKEKGDLWKDFFKDPLDLKAMLKILK